MGRTQGERFVDNLFMPITLPFDTIKAVTSPNDLGEGLCSFDSNGGRMSTQSIIATTIATPHYTYDTLIGKPGRSITGSDGENIFEDGVNAAEYAIENPDGYYVS